MCGIAGFTTGAKARPADGKQIASDMLRAIAHRGPDEQGIVAREELVLAHNRLTIMEPQGGQQPRSHAANGNVLVFNGEIYGHRQFDSELQAAGCELRDHCDTETLFWLLEVYGIDRTLQIIDGMFAFAWYHASSETLYLARDRFGQKPMFYAATDELVFASEIKALRRHPSLRTVAADIDALRLYLLMEYVPGSATGFKGIRQLPAGQVLSWRRGELEVRPYWTPLTIARNADYDAAASVQELERRLDESVERQLLADVPVGIFLSGGLDSSLIAAMARKHHRDVATFTVKFPYASFDESSVAAEVANALGTRHTTVELDRQSCTAGMESLLAAVDQPFCDSSALPTLLLCQATRSHVKVALGGDGADELFCGYPNFKLQRFAKWMALLPGATGKALQGLSRLWPGEGGYMNQRFLLRQLSYGIGQPAQLQSVHWMSAVPAALQRTLWRDGAGPTIDLEVMPGLSSLEQLQQQFISGYLPGSILQKIDRASMQVSLEVRSPFLSNAVSELALSLPIAASFRGMTGKRILRSVAAGYLDRRVIERRKHGFALPVSDLLRGDLRELAEPLLLDAANPMYEHLRRQRVTALWTEHQAGNQDFGKTLWALLMLAAFSRNQF